MPRKSTYKDEFIAVDFEIANSAYYSACSIGIVRVKGKEITEAVSYMIQPPDNLYNNDMMAVHGIKPEDTKNADLFPAVWEKIKHYFDDTYIAAHNANFDMSVLKAALAHYDIEFPSFKYFCSIPVSSLNIAEGVTVKGTLEERCKYYNIALEEHHNALCDATACAQLVLYALENSRYKAIDPLINMRVGFKSFDEVKLRTTFKIGAFEKTKAASVAENVEICPENFDSDFVGKTFVFTGEVSGMTRESVYAKVIAGGGAVADGVSKKVDILVNADNRVSGKVKRALELQEKGHHIKIISGEEFIEMLNN